MSSLKISEQNFELAGKAKKTANIGLLGWGMLINLIGQGPSQTSMTVLVSDNEGLWQASVKALYQCVTLNKFGCIGLLIR